MDTAELFDAERSRRVSFVLVASLVVLVSAVVVASLVQRDWGRIRVTNVRYDNFNGIPIRAKLLRPENAAPDRPLPGLVYIHGYQNNRETSDAYCIELARRGFVVLNMDAIGRGNSGIPNDPAAPDFDVTYGARTSLEYLRRLPYVDAERTGMMGHSLGAEMAYAVALDDPTVEALVISGFAYTLDASDTRPKNMLMIIGQYDEYRQRMTGVRDIEREWMGSPQTRQVIPVENPQLGVTYGEFALGTARRVFVPRTIHIQESHSRAAIAQALEWMRAALHPPEQYWIDPHSQTWPTKEWATLVAMLAGLGSILPLGLLLLRTGFFRSLQGAVSDAYACTRRAYWRFTAINGLLMWLYLPLILALFGLHVYVVPIDTLFPMMMVNGIVWWFLCTNLIGFLILRRWFKRESQKSGLTWYDLGVSHQKNEFSIDGGKIGKTVLLAGILFAFVYASEAILERVFIVDFRFIFPFASDLTLYRAGMFIRYFPFILIGFLLQGIFLHGQLRGPRRQNWLKTYVAWTSSNLLTMILPLVLFMMVQYVPLLTAGVIPFVGPGGVLVSFTMNLFHIIGVLVMVIPISTWFYQLTGNVYLGGLVNAALVTWMFTSSQVIAPIPI